MKIGRCPQCPESDCEAVKRSSVAMGQELPYAAQQRYTGARFLSLRCGDLDRAAAPRAVAAIYAERDRTVDRHAAHDAPLVAIVIDRLVLRCAIIPDHHVAGLPA